MSRTGLMAERADTDDRDERFDWLDRAIAAGLGDVPSTVIQRYGGRVPRAVITRYGHGDFTPEQKEHIAMAALKRHREANTTGGAH